MINLALGTLFQQRAEGARLPFVLGTLVPETLREATFFELAKRSSPLLETATDRAFVLIGLRDNRTKFDSAIIDTSGLKPLAHTVGDVVFYLPDLVTGDERIKGIVEDFLIEDNPLFDIRIDPYGAWQSAQDARWDRADPLAGSRYFKAEREIEDERKAGEQYLASLHILFAARNGRSGIIESFPLYTSDP